MMLLIHTRLKLKNETTEEQGFTLIELLVVILIIGILAAIAIPMFLNQKKAASDAVLKTDIKSVVLAQESFFVKNPLAAGTIKKVDLKETASRLSNQTVIGVWAVDHVGYCVVGYNKGGDHSGGGNDQLKYLWYDSALGGFTTPTDDATPPIGGACQSPRPPAAEQAWYYADSGGWTGTY